MKAFFCFLIALFAISSTEAQVKDDIVERRILKERRVLPYAQLREADVFWEKRIWRLIDVREKMNLAFLYPDNPFFEILAQAAEKGDLQLYSAEDDKFSFPLSMEELNGKLYRVDTVLVPDPESYELESTVVKERLFYEDIKRFRVKEVWFFDEQTASLKVRILGIAPLKDVTDEFGNFRYEQPLFWIYYPELRQILARHKVYLEGNDATAMSWEDLFEMRRFSSTIYKSSNVRDRRLKDYLSGVDRLLEADKIKKELFNFEHDLWSY
ncbi:MAG: gliding motility protein GldN [Bacteroidota bacterium]